MIDAIPSPNKRQENHVILRSSEQKLKFFDERDGDQIVRGRDVRRKGLYERRHRADLTRVLDTLVHIAQRELRLRRHPPGQIHGHFLFPFMDWLTPPALLIVKVATEL